MLTLKLIHDDPEYVIRKLAVKHFDAREIIQKIIVLDDHRKALQTNSDALLAEQKKAAAAIGQLMKEGKKEEAEAAKIEVGALKARSTELLAMADANNTKLIELLSLLPNIPCDLVPEGAGAEDNVVVKMGGPEPKLPEGALPHWDLAKKYDIIVNYFIFMICIRIFFKFNFLSLKTKKASTLSGSCLVLKYLSFLPYISFSQCFTSKLSLTFKSLSKILYK